MHKLVDVLLCWSLLEVGNLGEGMDFGGGIIRVKTVKGGLRPHIPN